MLTWVADKVISPKITTSYLFNSVVVTTEISSAINAFHPSDLNISTGYRLKGFAAELISNIGPPGPFAGMEGLVLDAIVKFHTESFASELPERSFIPLALVP